MTDKNCDKRFSVSQGTLFVPASLSVCTLYVELVEYLDKSEALEVGVRRLEPEDCALEEAVAVVCLLSPLGSL